MHRSANFGPSWPMQLKLYVETAAAWGDTFLSTRRFPADAPGMPVLPELFGVRAAGGRAIRNPARRLARGAPSAPLPPPLQGWL